MDVPNVHIQDPQKHLQGQEKHQKAKQESGREQNSDPYSVIHIMYVQFFGW